MKHGRFWEMDGDGCIVNDCAPERIEAEWRDLVASAADACREGLGDALDGCYLTGSVARGLAVPGRSDLDMIAVTRDALNADDAWASDAEVALQRSFPIASDVGFEIWPTSWLAGDAADTWIFPFILKVHAISVFGRDLAAGIRRYRVEPEIARDDVMQIDADITEAVDELERAVDIRAASYWSRRISKNVLRAGFGLVMLEVGRYTRDSDLCLSAFLDRHPERTTDMVVMKRVVDGHPISLDDLLPVLRGVQGWIAPLADRWLEDHAEMN